MVKMKSLNQTPSVSKVKQDLGETLQEFYTRSGLSSPIRREILDSIRSGKNPNLDTIFAYKALGSSQKLSILADTTIPDEPQDKPTSYADETAVQEIRG
jgi:hypothetical protein